MGGGSYNRSVTAIGHTCVCGCGRVAGDVLTPVNATVWLGPVTVGSYLGILDSCSNASVRPVVLDVLGTSRAVTVSITGPRRAAAAYTLVLQPDAAPAAAGMLMAFRNLGARTAAVLQWSAQGAASRRLRGLQGMSGSDADDNALSAPASECIEDAVISASGLRAVRRINLTRGGAPADVLAASVASLALPANAVDVIVACLDEHAHLMPSVLQRLAYTPSAILLVDPSRFASWNSTVSDASAYFTTTAALTPAARARLPDMDALTACGTAWVQGISASTLVDVIAGAGLSAPLITVVIAALEASTIAWMRVLDNRQLFGVLTSQAVCTVSSGELSFSTLDGSFSVVRLFQTATQLLAGGVSITVWPQSAPASMLRYPAISWQQRACEASAQCGQQGVCQADGTCRCFSTYIGSACNINYLAIILPILLVTMLATTAYVVMLLLQCRRQTIDSRRKRRASREMRMVQRVQREVHERTIQYALHELGNPVHSILYAVKELKLTVRQAAASRAEHSAPPLVTTGDAAQHGAAGSARWKPSSQLSPRGGHLVQATMRDSRRGASVSASPMMLPPVRSHTAHSAGSASEAVGRTTVSTADTQSPLLIAVPPPRASSPLRIQASPSVGAIGLTGTASQQLATDRESIAEASDSAPTWEHMMAHIGQIRIAAGHLNRLVADLRTTESALLTGKLPVVLARCDIAAILRDARHQLHSMLSVKSHAFIDSRLPAVIRTDALRLRQLLAHAVTNMLREWRGGRPRQDSAALPRSSNSDVPAGDAGDGVQSAHGSAPMVIIFVRLPPAVTASSEAQSEGTPEVLGANVSSVEDARSASIAAAPQRTLLPGQVSAELFPTNTAGSIPAPKQPDVFPRPLAPGIRWRSIHSPEAGDRLDFAVSPGTWPSRIGSGPELGGVSRLATTVSLRPPPGSAASARGSARSEVTGSHVYAASSARSSITVASARGSAPSVRGSGLYAGRSSAAASRMYSVNALVDEHIMDDDDSDEEVEQEAQSPDTDATNVLICVRIVDDVMLAQLGSVEALALFTPLDGIFTSGPAPVRSASAGRSSLPSQLSAELTGADASSPVPPARTAWAASDHRDSAGLSPAAPAGHETAAAVEIPGMRLHAMSVRAPVAADSWALSWRACHELSRMLSANMMYLPRSAPRALREDLNAAIARQLLRAETWQKFHGLDVRLAVKPATRPGAFLQPTSRAMATSLRRALTVDRMSARAGTSLVPLQEVPDAFPSQVFEQDDTHSSMLTPDPSTGARFRVSEMTLPPFATSHAYSPSVSPVVVMTTSSNTAASASLSPVLLTTTVPSTSPPLHKSHSRAELELQPDIVETPPSVGAPRPIHVLVVDDEPINRRMCARMLTRLGVASTLLEDGEDAVRFMLEPETQIPAQSSFGGMTTRDSIDRGDSASLRMTSLSPLRSSIAHRRQSVDGVVIFATPDAHDSGARVHSEPSVGDTQHVDAIFMDIVMHRMDGVTAAKQLIGAGIRVPIIAVTAQASAADLERYQAAGLAGCIAKPFTQGMLAAALSKVLHTPGLASPSATIDIGTPSATSPSDLTSAFAAHSVAHTD